MRKMCNIIVYIPSSLAGRAANRNICKYCRGNIVTELIAAHNRVIIYYDCSLLTMFEQRFLLFLHVDRPPFGEIFMTAAWVARDCVSSHFSPAPSCFSNFPWHFAHFSPADSRRNISKFKISLLLSRQKCFAAVSLRCRGDDDRNRPHFCGFLHTLVRWLTMKVIIEFRKSRSSARDCKSLIFQPSC